MLDSESAGFELKSDEELVEMYRNGIQDAFGELSVRYIFVIRSASAGLYNMGVETDDLYQEGLVALHSAVKSYDDGGGASFRTYAAVCIKNRLMSAVRSANNKRNFINNTAVSIYDEPMELSAPFSEPEGLVVAEEGMKDILRTARDRLSELEFRVMELYIDGNSYEEISKLIGVSVKVCDNAMQRVRRKLKSLREQ